MIKIILMQLLIMISCTSLDTSLSKREASILQELDCSKTGYEFSNEGKLIFKGNSKEVSYFLVKNKLNNLLNIDFPEGHIGATAWITQHLETGKWHLYKFIKNKDTLRVESGIREKIKWVCTEALRDMSTSGCDKSLFVCKINDLTKFKKAIQNKIKNFDKSFWIDDPLSLDKLISRSYRKKHLE